MDSPTFVRSTDGVWLNLARIVSIEPEGSCSRITVTTSDKWFSSETPEQFLTRIRDAHGAFVA